MKKRLKNLLTTIIGLMLALIGIGMAIDTYFIRPNSWTLIEWLMVVLLGWIFIWAKDTIIEGITLKLFKITKPEKKSA